ncbi:hypothetical protein GYA49_00385 [Candidatus Beckwithbacteria bacterium]|nr:hypothetical protein [Candidatus Beckwithbacteria bacterium]
MPSKKPNNSIHTVPKKYKSNIFFPIFLVFLLIGSLLFLTIKYTKGVEADFNPDSFTSIFNKKINEVVEAFEQAFAPQPEDDKASAFKAIPIPPTGTPTATTTPKPTAVPTIAPKTTNQYQYNYQVQATPTPTQVSQNNSSDFDFEKYKAEQDKAWEEKVAAQHKAYEDRVAEMNASHDAAVQKMQEDLEVWKKEHGFE